MHVRDPQRSPCQSGSVDRITPGTGTYADSNMHFAADRTDKCTCHSQVAYIECMTMNRVYSATSLMIQFAQATVINCPLDSS